MNSDRKSAAQREKDFRLAIYRIESGRARTGSAKLSISAVAKEAGVSSSLIHNHYPTIAEEIRSRLSGRGGKSQGAASNETRAVQALIKRLRVELRQARVDLRALASINEMLLLELDALRAIDKCTNVKSFPASVASAESRTP